jgi:hypothetical protein
MKTQPGNYLVVHPGQFPVHPLLDLLDLLAHALIQGTEGRAGPLEPGLASPGVAPKQLVNQLHPPVGPTLPPVGALDRVDKVPALMRPAIRQLQGPVWPQQRKIARIPIHAHNALGAFGEKVLWHLPGAGRFQQESRHLRAHHHPKPP